ncbi:MAG: hypothetical protein ACRDLT_05530 [Solirubrobacteraceae bacterium]
MCEDQEAHLQSPEEQAHVGPPNLILQAIVPPTDAPVEIRAAVAGTLARGVSTEHRTYTWEDVSFAASALALLEGTDQRAQPDTHWVFALSADSPRLGEQIHSSGAWSSTILSHAYAHGDGRLLWRVSVFDAVTTAPRRGTAAGGADRASS